MSTTSDDLKNFNQFVLQQLESNAESKSRLPELFDQWMHQNPSDEEYTENVAAIAASIDDFLTGERGTPAGQHSAKLRAEFGITNE